MANISSSPPSTNKSSDLIKEFRINPARFFCQSLVEDEDDGHEDFDERDYFDFTEENLKASRVNECYSNWSSIAMSTPTYKEKGEIRYFVWLYGYAPNFKCVFSEEGECRGTLS
jgi:hypothetical protein